MRANLTLSKKSWLAILLIFFILTGYYTYLGFTAPLLGNSDQVNVGVMVNKLLQPELYSQDYVFKDTSFFEFYTPTFLQSLSFLESRTGQFEYALAFYIPVIMMGYLIGMFLLMYAITKNFLISLSVTIVSSYNHRAIAGTWWGVNGIGFVMPRSLFLLFIPWLFLFLYHWLHERNLAKMSLLGLTIGLLTNIHPVSGFLFAQILFPIILISWGLSKKTIWTVLLVGFLLILGALPMLSNFLETTEQTPSTTDLDYDSYLDVTQIRYDYSLFPYPSDTLTILKHPISAQEQIVIVWTYLFFMGGWLWWGAWKIYFIKDSALTNRSFLALLLIQLPLAYLLSSFSAHALIIFTLAFGIFTIQANNKLKRWNWYFLAIMILSIVLSFVSNYFIMLFLTRWQSWRIASLIVEQSRIAKFVYLPLFIFTAQFLQEIYRLLPATWHRNALIVSICWLIVAHSIYVSFLPAILCLAILIKLRQSQKLKFYAYLDFVLIVALIVGVLAIASTSLIASIQQRADFTAVLDDDRSLYEWAKTSTVVDSLFYFDSLNFRFEAQRSITHSWKDLALAYYSKSALVPFYERYNALEKAYEDPDLLQQTAVAFKVDYLVVPNHLNLKIDLPLTFENNSYSVYAIQHDIDR